MTKISAHDVEPLIPQQRSRRNTAESMLCPSVVVGANGNDYDEDVFVNHMGFEKKGFSSGWGLWKLIFVNMLVCGIEFCASAGFTYIPPMLLKSGFTETTTTSIMGIGPFIALATIPFLGVWSDRCRSSLGRRRPFILALSLIIIVAVVLIAFGQRIGVAVAPNTLLGSVLLALGVVTLDYGCHAAFNPCEALLADMMKHSDNREKGFTVYSSMISLGGCIGYFVTAVDWSSTSFGCALGGQEQTAFSCILFLFLITLTTTVLVADDHPYTPTQQTKDPFSLKDTGSQFKTMIYVNKMQHSNYDDVGYETGSNDSIESYSGQLTRASTPVSEEEVSLLKSLSMIHAEKVTPYIDRRFAVSVVVWWIRTWPLLLLGLPRRVLHRVVNRVRSYCNVPLVLRRLFVANFCSWTALMCHNMFYTDYVGQAVYHGNPNAQENTIEQRLYNDGVRMGSWGLLLHSITSIIYANLLQKYIIRIYGRRFTYFIGLAVFTVCMIGTLMSNNLTVINILVAFSGTGFAAITTIPNMLITDYHTDKEIYFSDILIKVNNSKKTHALDKDKVCRSEEEEEAGESRGFATDISVLDSAYILSQIILSLFVGTIVDVTHSVSAYIVISILFGLLACYFSTKVIFTPNCMLQARGHNEKLSSY